MSAIVSQGLTIAGITTTGEIYWCHHQGDIHHSDDIYLMVACGNFGLVVGLTINRKIRILDYGTLDITEKTILNEGIITNNRYDYRMVSCGFNHITGLTTDGKMICWGKWDRSYRSARRWNERTDLTYTNSDSFVYITSTEDLTIGITTDKRCIFWTNNLYILDRLNIFERYRFNHIVCSGDIIAGLTTDGTIICNGHCKNPLSYHTYDSNYYDISSLIDSTFRRIMENHEEIETIACNEAQLAILTNANRVYIVSTKIDNSIFSINIPSLNNSNNNSIQFNRNYANLNNN